MVLANRSRWRGRGANYVPSVFTNAHVECANGYAIAFCNIGRKRTIWHQVSRSFCRRKCSVFNTHPFVPSLAKLGLRNSRNFVSHSTVRKPCVVPLVSGLFFCIRPSTVARSIVAIVVDPVDGQTVVVPIGYGPIPKGLIAVGPVFANSDTSPAVVNPPMIVWVPAPIEHVSPYPEQSGVAFAVPCHSSSSYLFAKTAARSCSGFAQLLSIHDDCITAFADARPSNASFTNCAASMENFQSSKNTASEVNKV